MAQNKSPSNFKSKLISVIFFAGLTLSALLQRLICQNHSYLSQKIFGLASFTDDSQKLTILKQSLLYMATFEFLIAYIVIKIRMLGQKISPVAEKDPLSISLLNRILANNIEQSFVFFSLYSYLLFGAQNFQQKYIISLPLIFLIGRIFFTVGYIIGTITGIPTGRSFGFAFSVSVNALMLLEFILNLSDIYKTFLFA